MHTQHGLTLLELLLVLGIMAVLTAVTILALRPSEELAALRDAKRQQDIEIILQAVLQYAVDHDGELPEGISKVPREICRSFVEDCGGLTDLSLLFPLYLERLPIDPRSEDTRSTGYSIASDPDGRVEVSAPLTEGSSAPLTEKR